MFGFYNFVGSRLVREADAGGGGGVYHDGHPWNESAFVPMHEGG
jgi:hypothetical protein